MNRFEILLVDDEAIILLSLKMELKRRYKKYTIHTVLNAEHAIDILTQKGDSIALVISDWLLPGIKGDELLIHVNTHYPEIKKILITGQAPDDVLSKIKELAGLDLYIPKPWNSNELFSFLDPLLK
jgi:DNA-binding NtrC family response regulator